jgi:hypothetical protein
MSHCEFIIASKLELAGADIDALLVLYCGFEKLSSAMLKVFLFFLYSSLLY